MFIILYSNLVPWVRSSAYISGVPALTTAECLAQVCLGNEKLEGTISHEGSIRKEK